MTYASRPVGEDDVVAETTVLSLTDPVRGVCVVVCVWVGGGGTWPRVPNDVAALHKHTRTAFVKKKAWRLARGPSFRGRRVRACGVEMRPRAARKNAHHRTSPGDNMCPCPVL